MAFAVAHTRTKRVAVMTEQGPEFVAPDPLDASHLQLLDLDPNVRSRKLAEEKEQVLKHGLSCSFLFWGPVEIQQPFPPALTYYLELAQLCTCCCAGLDLQPPASDRDLCHGPGAWGQLSPAGPMR